MGVIRVRRTDSENVVAEEWKNNSPSEGRIASAEGWLRFCASLPKHPSKKQRGVFLIALDEDAEYKNAVDALTVREYSWPDLMRWLDRLARPTQTLIESTASGAKWSMHHPSAKSHTITVGA